jgi:methylornithine synthase
MIRNIIEKVLAGGIPNLKDNRMLLQIRDSAEKELLFTAARDLRERYFGKEIFFYGFLYISTFCSNCCTFCSYRMPNKELTRYRKRTAEIVEAAATLAESGVHLIDLTMGEDPYYRSGPGFEELLGIVREVKRAASLPVMVSPGLVTARQLSMLRGFGADWYACYQENFDRKEFARLRPRQDYNKRLEVKQEARSHGLLIEEGVLTGAGESIESIDAMKQIGASQIRVMAFVPGVGIPLVGDGSRPDREACIIAVLRLNFPRLLIPASLDVEGLSGLEKRLAAGANVVTSLVPPGRGFAGVANKDLDIEIGARSMERVGERITRCGMEPAGRERYRGWMRARLTAEEKLCVSS